MNTSNNIDCRCERCGALLAKRDSNGGFAVHRSTMHSSITGADFTYSTSCYRCGALNVWLGGHSRVTTPSTPAGDA